MCYVFTREISLYRSIRPFERYTALMSKFDLWNILFIITIVSIRSTVFFFFSLSLVLSQLCWIFFIYFVLSWVSSQQTNNEHSDGQKNRPGNTKLNDFALLLFYGFNSLRAILIIKKLNFFYFVVKLKKRYQNDDGKINQFKT